MRCAQNDFRFRRGGLQRILLPFLALFIVFSPPIIAGQQVSSADPATIADHPKDQDGSSRVIHDSAPQCSGRLEAVRVARENVENDRETAANSSGVMGVPDNLRQDLADLMLNVDALHQCNSQNSGMNDGPPPGMDCTSELLLNFQVSHDGEPAREIPILHLSGNDAFFFISGMTIDADGAPNAYHPDNTGLDDLSNAGAPGNWQGLAKDGDGEPYVQGPNDPFPGYYVSATALADRARPVNDPLRYVDASKIPYIVLPGGMARELGARPGDFAFVMNRRNGKSSYAIFGDVGPFDRVGEGSVALAENLGIHSDARNGGTRGGIQYLIFSGSGNGRPRTLEEIGEEGEKLLQLWGDPMQLAACTAGQWTQSGERNRNTN